MSTIPTSGFADRLQTLSHDEFRSFVTDLWSLAGWDTSVEDGTVVVRKNDREQRLLVLPAGRLARLRSQTPPSSQFDQVVTPRIENTDIISLDETEKPLVDARDLRHRLIYGCESGAAEDLWSGYFDEPLRATEWENTGPPLTWTQAGLAVSSLVLVAGAIAVLALGIPFLEGDSPTSQASASTLDDGLDAELDLGPTEQTVDEPAAIAWGETVYAGSDDGTVAAVDGESGETVWSTDLSAQVRSPLVSNGTVYVRSLDGVHALDAVTGELQWNYTDLSTDWAHYDVYSSASTRLTVVNDSVYFSDSEGISALDARTGQELWSVPLAGTATDEPKILNGTLYVTTPDSELLAYDAATGVKQWQAQYSDEKFQTHSLVNVLRHEEGNNSLLVGDQSTLYELDAQTGERGWTFEGEVSGDFSQPLVLDRGSSLGLGESATNVTGNGSTVYVADNRAYLYALDPETGERLWEYQEAGTQLEHPTVGGPVVNESAYSVYFAEYSPVLDAESAIVAINGSSGEERWQVKDENAEIQSPTVFGDTMYAGTDTGELLAIDTEDGTERWRVDAFDGIVTGTVSVATESLGGDSVDSRIRLGAQGHHDWFATREQSGAERTDGIAVIETEFSETVAAEEKLDVRVSLVNQGDSPDNTTVAVEPEWDVPTDSALQTEIDLDPGQAREVTFSFAVPSEPGEYSNVLHIGEERSPRTVAVSERPDHKVTGLDDPDTVWQDDEGEIITSVRNTGEIEATTPIGLEFNGEVVDSTQRTLAPNETVSVTFSLSPGDVPAGEYNYSVATSDHVESASLEVLAVDRREDALPIVTQVFGVTLLLSGLALGWWVLTDIRGPLLRRTETGDEQ